jgi:hypothetical protein
MARLLAVPAASTHAAGEDVGRYPAGSTRRHGLRAEVNRATPGRAVIVAAASEQNASTAETVRTTWASCHRSRTLARSDGGACTDQST